MCKKQTAVSHSSTESEIISLDAGLRLDGLPALEVWDLIVSVLGNVSRVSDRSGQPDNDVPKRHQPHKKIDVMKDIDAVPSNVQSARQEALLYVFEDNEAVIKMIMKGRSPTMSHVSRTHRVALDWLFDRINLDPKIQIKYIDTRYNLVHKFIPMPQAMKIPAAKAAVDKEWEKLEKFSAWNLTKVRSKKEVIDEARTLGATDHFASLMDICHLKNG